MLEERVDPGAATSRVFARLSRQIGRELGMDQLSVARIALAGHLYALDIALRREVGSMVRADVASVFEAAPGTPGGLGPTLRMLGARALGLSDRRDSEAAGITVLRVVADYLDLRERSGPEAEPDQIGKALLQSGADPKVVAALTGAIRRTEGVGLRTERTTEKPATGR